MRKIVKSRCRIVKIRFDSLSLPHRPSPGDPLKEVFPDCSIVLHKYDNSPFPGCVISAPHGGSDLFAPDVCRLVSKELKISRVLASNFRDLGKNRWINVNRPTECDVIDGVPEKITRKSKTSLEIYTAYRDTLFCAAGGAPLKTLIEIHTRDPIVPVTEIVMPGFSKEIVLGTKTYALEHTNKFIPQTEFLELLDDGTYIENTTGLRCKFTYRASRARAIGSFSSEVSDRGIHIELPPQSIDTKEKQFAVAKHLSLVLRKSLELVKILDCQ